MNAKIYNGNVQPNPKEYKIWVNDEGTIKTWNGTKWVESAASSGGSGSGSGSGSDKKYFTFYNWSGYPYNGDDETLSNQIAFTFEFEEGMTWEDWINSKYNVLGMSFFDSGDYAQGRVFLCISGENGSLPIGIITIAYNPQDEFGSLAMYTDLIRENNNFVYSGNPAAF